MARCAGRPYNYAILMNMQTPREYWPRWAELLKRFQLDHFAAWMLEAGGPLALLGAQALYFSRSFLGTTQIDALARTLEDDSEVRAFVAYLQAERPRGSGVTHD
jgi:hypothetical protein